MGKLIDKELQSDFEWVISHWVGRSLEESKVGKVGLRWKLTKIWNSRTAHAGISRMVRESLGEEDATRLFQDICDEILKNPDKLSQAVRDYKSFIQEAKDTLYQDNNDNEVNQSTATEYLSSKNVTNSVADVALLSSLISALSKNSIEHELHNYDNKISITVRGYGSIVGNRLPLRIESVIGGYDPMKTQTDSFVDLIDKINNELKYGRIHFEHIDNPDAEDNEITGALHMLNDLATLQENGKISSFVETIVYYNSKFTTPLTEEAFIALLKAE